MLDVNMIIANNIQAELKKENKKQVDLAEGIGVSKQTMSKIMNGARAINAIELHKISEYLHVLMDSLMKMPEKPMDTNVIHAFMGRVKTEEARKGIQLADELSDMILFHTRVCENGKKMEQPWEDLQKKNSQNWKRQRKCQSRLMRIALKPHLSGRLNLEELIRRVTEWMPMGHNHNQEKNI